MAELPIRFRPFDWRAGDPPHSRPATFRAIDTHYRGYKFRSRLEARWAVFFDSAGIAYQYEPQGFVIGDTPYLPDFYLPAHGLWVEIKGTLPGNPSRRLASGLREATRQDVLILAGDCWPHAYKVYYHWPEEADPGPDNLDADDPEPFGGDGHDTSMICRCRRCDGLTVNYYDFYGGAYQLEGWGGTPGRHSCGDHDRAGIPFEEEHYRLARSARFEHGETPGGKGGGRG
jgi:hypothetical protein